MTFAIGEFVVRISFGQLLFFVQLILAEAMFLYSYNKRRLFALRLAGALLLCFALAVLLYKVLPERSDMGSAPMAVFTTQFIEFLRIVLQIFITLIGAAICFNECLSTLVSACMAGYAAQHFTFNAERLLEMFVPIRQNVARDYYNLVVMAIFVAIYVALYFIFACPAVKNDYKNNGNKWLNILSVAVIFIVVLINRFMSVDKDVGFMQNVANRVYGMAFCLLALIIQYVLYRVVNLRAEAVTMQALLKQNARQYEQWKASIDDINIRYHDLKHELAFLKQTAADAGRIEQLEGMLSGYGNVVHTGSEELDVLIAGKKIVCHREGIELDCVAAQDVLASFNGLELYSLFGNAIDNAIEAVMKIDDTDGRIIGLRIHAVGQMVTINLKNSFHGEVKLDEDGFPVTTKEDKRYHGFGLKSIRYVVEKYEGSVAVQVEYGMFNLNVLIPLPSQ